MEKYLGERLLEFNEITDNQYREKWGSILSYLNNDVTCINGELFSPDEIFKLQINRQESIKLLE